MHNKFQSILGPMVLTLVLTFSVSANSQTDSTMTELSGPYFGQKPPGNRPELFAPGFISTSGYDMPPTFSPALDELFFTKRPTEAGSDNQLYYARQVDGLWQVPTLAPFSSGAMEFEAQFSCDGQTIFYGRDQQLCFSEKTATGWSEAKSLKPPVDEGMCIAVAQNGNMYFTAARAGKYGIWRYQRRDNKYGQPKLVMPLSAHPWPRTSRT